MMAFCDRECGGSIPFKSEVLTAIVKDNHSPMVMLPPAGTLEPGKGAHLG
jgi:hypothetical protein